MLKEHLKQVLWNHKQRVDNYFHFDDTASYTPSNWKRKRAQYNVAEPFFVPEQKM